jgi:hypothetical protein
LRGHSGGADVGSRKDFSLAYFFGRILGCMKFTAIATSIAVGGFYVLDQFLFDGQYSNLAIRMARVAAAAFGIYV